MSAFQRIAIYWTPDPDSAFDAFGRAWFADDPSAETSLAGSPALPPGLRVRAVKDPSRYRLHATLKAPFRLAETASVEDVRAALQAFCSSRRTLQTGPLVLMRHQRYLALMPRPPVAAVEWLASQCVTRFDRFRASLSDEDRELRTAGQGHARDRLVMEEFGYPYIFDKFAFHITLAGPLGEDDLNAVEKALRAAVEPFERPLQISGLTLLGEPCGGGRFQVIERFPLRR